MSIHTTSLARKFNPNHGPDGEFASAPGAVSKDDVKKSFKAEPTKEGHHDFHVRDEKGQHVGIVANVSLDPDKKPMWLAYHDTEGFMSHDVPDHSPFAAKGATRDELSYRGSKEEAIDDLATMHTSHTNKMKIYEAEAKSKATVAQKEDKTKCPRCGSKKYALMPTDFETAKCSECGKTWDHGIVPGVNDPNETKKKFDIGTVRILPVK